MKPVGMGLPEGIRDAAAASVRRRTGLTFTDARRPTFEAAIATAMRRAGVTDPQAYLDRLDADSAALDDLVAEITVGETYFFREPEQFTLIERAIVPVLLSDRHGKRPLRLWSAGCATGEEAYTLAILMRGLGLASDAHIVGTDLSPVALTRAREARYTPWSLRGVSEQIVGTYFQRSGSRLTLAPAVRNQVEFRYLNLAEDTYPGIASGIWGMDLILCRNVLIYFDPETVTRVARRLLDSLSENGWLFLGASDPALSDLVPCEVTITEAGLAYRRPRRDAWGAAEGEPIFVTIGRDPPPSETVPPPSGATPTGSPPSKDGGNDQGTEGDPSPSILEVRALANLGRIEEASRACAAGLHRYPLSAELTYLNAALLSEAGHFTAAAAAARSALYLDRSLIVAHVTLGTVLARLGAVEGADRAFGNAVQLLSRMAPEEVVPATDGERAERLSEMLRVHRGLLRNTIT